MYADGKVLIAGGNAREPDPNATPSASTEVIDLNAATPAFRAVSPMFIERTYLTASS